MAAEEQLGQEVEIAVSGKDIKCYRTRNKRAKVSGEHWKDSAGGRKMTIQTNRRYENAVNRGDKAETLSKT